MGRKKTKTEEELRQTKRDYDRKWQKDHYDPQKRREKYLKEKERIESYNYQIPIVRARCLLSSYNTEDAKYSRGKGNLTAQWIVENIFSKSCVHCGETDWHKLGCNRLDNLKPHTMDNVEPCCYHCNCLIG